jgi:hypothetical protein
LTLTLNSCSPARAFTYSLSRPGVVDGAAASSRGGAMAASTATASPTLTRGADASGRASSCSMSPQTATPIRLSEVSSRNCAKQRQASFDEAGRSSNLLTYSLTHLLTYSLTHLLPPPPPSSPPHSLTRVYAMQARAKCRKLHHAQLSPAGDVEEGEAESHRRLRAQAARASEGRVRKGSCFPRPYAFIRIVLL